jgi:hypothetical protein
VPGQVLEHLARTGHCERQDDAVGLRQRQRGLDGAVRGARVAQVAVRACGEEVGLDDGQMADDGRRPVPDVAQGLECGPGIAVGEVDGRAAVANLSRGGPVAIERGEGRPRLVGQAEPGPRDQQPAGHLVREDVRSHQLGGVKWSV